MSETEFLQTAQEAARAAGDVLQSWAERFTVSEKSRANLVTEADLAAQETIFRLIRGRYPDHNFLGEENLSVTTGRSPYRWVIDPLDGTTNYVHRFPFYAVSIGLEHDGELLAGVIHDPNRDEMFTAVRGQGARRNGEPLATSKVEAVGEAFLVASLPIASDPSNAAVARFLRALPAARTVQRLGSAALALSYVACGRIDAFWSTSLKPWDMAAGALIVREAGGRTSRLEGTPLDLDVPDILATNGTSLHTELQALLR